jgi:hypothetical protein
MYCSGFFKESAAIPDETVSPDSGGIPFSINGLFSLNSKVRKIITHTQIMYNYPQSIITITLEK